jgi:formate/nitrite transporter FocA (FNT family)
MKKLEDPEKANRRKRLVWRILTAVAAIVAIIVFILTQDITAPMILVDIWTILHAIIFVLQLIMIVMAATWKREDAEEQAVGQEEYSEYSGAPAN